MTAALAAAALLAVAPLPAAASDDPEPSVVTAEPAPEVDSLEGLSAPVLDIITTVESPDGAEAVDETAEARTVVLTGQVLFEENEATLGAQARTRLEEVARQVTDSGATGVVQVNGYTDDQGSAALGLRLSDRRAAAVRRVLEPLLAGTGTSVATKGYGEADPRFPNATEDGTPIPENQARNRRVEIVFTPARASSD